MKDVKEVVMRFPVEDGTPRMFVATTDQKKGISIHDIDNDVVVAKGILKGAIPSVQLIIEGMLEGIDWNAFRRWLTSREQYSPPSENYDIEQDRPNPGNAMAQIRYTPQEGDWVDARTAEMKAEDSDRKNPVSFPPASLNDMALSIAAHDKFLDPGDGRSRLCWKLPIDMSALIGEGGDGDLTDPDMDAEWDEHALSEEYRDEFVTLVGNRVFSSNTIAYNLSDDGIVTLESYRGLPMNFASLSELTQKCKGMKDALVPFYADVRRVDVAMKNAPELIREITIERRQAFENDRNMPSAVDLG